MRIPHQTAERIARQVLRIPTLRERNSDSLDFHEIGVWRLERALAEAYASGYQAAKAGGRRPVARNARIAVVDPLEERAISLLGSDWSGRQNMVVRAIRRKSDRQFDLEIDGMYGTDKNRYPFSGWLPLMVVGEARWTAPKYARLSCCPKIATDGDWSAIRDSNVAQIWSMFKLARKELGF